MMTALDSLENSCRSRLNLSDINLPDEYYYSCLPLCVIDSIFSIGVSYESTRNTVSRYCSHFGMDILRKDRKNLPSIHTQQSVNGMCSLFDETGVDFFARNIFRNLQRTSTRNGILKAKAVYDLCILLRKYDVEYFQDIAKISSNEGFDSDFKKIAGQASGVSLNYFFMLSGSEDHIKPDRMLLRFLYDATGQKFNSVDSQTIVREVLRRLNVEYPLLTMRSLDYIIWNYQRSRPLAVSGNIS